MKKRIWTVCAQLSFAGMLACGPAHEGTEDASLKTLSIDPELKNKVALQACSDRSECQDNEVVFVHKPDGQAFAKGYRQDGYISFQGDDVVWNAAAQSVTIGRVSGTSVTALCSQEFEKVCDLELSIKYPNDATEGDQPFYFASFRLRSAGEGLRMGEGSSHSKTLLDYVVQAPNQENAGTCNLMAATGAMEILLNQWKKSQGYAVSTAVNGPSDLSEPYTINIASNYGYGQTLTPILAYNSSSSGLLSRDFPFLNSYNGYNAKNNWSRQTPKASRVTVPRVHADVLFGGTSLNDASKWDVALLNESHVQMVKNELRKNRPVLVTYNHNDFWHVVVVVGYDDEVSENCQMVRNYYSNPKARYRDKFRAAFDRSGNHCRAKGVFYVRDSLGPQARTPKYGVRSYDWLKYLGNHIISVHQ